MSLAVVEMLLESRKLSFGDFNISFWFAEGGKVETDWGDRRIDSFLGIGKERDVSQNPLEIGRRVC